MIDSSTYVLIHLSAQHGRLSVLGFGIEPQMSLAWPLVLRGGSGSADGAITPQPLCSLMSEVQLGVRNLNGFLTASMSLP